MNALVAAPLHTENVVQSTELSLDLVGKTSEMQSAIRSESDGNCLPAARRTSLYLHSFMAKLNEACNFSRRETYITRHRQTLAVRNEKIEDVEKIAKSPVRSSRMKCNGATHNYIWREGKILRLSHRANIPGLRELAPAR